MSLVEPAFCPWCQQELHAKAIEAFSNNIFWSKCNTSRCSGAKHQLKTDKDGFILEPPIVRGWYIHRQRITYEY